MRFAAAACALAIVVCVAVFGAMLAQRAPPVLAQRARGWAIGAIGRAQRDQSLWNTFSDGAAPSKPSSDQRSTTR